MIPIDLRSEETIVDGNNRQIYVSIHTAKEGLFTVKVNDIDKEFTPEDMKLLEDSLVFLVNKYNEAILYIKSKNENL